MNLMKWRKRVMFLLNSIKPVFVFAARRYEAPLSLQVPERDRVRPVRRQGGGRVDAMIRKYQSIYETFTWLVRVKFKVNN